MSNKKTAHVSQEPENELPKLSPELDGKFELLDYAPGVMRISGFGEVDFTTISLEHAQLIHDSGNCPHLVKAQSSEVSTLKES